MPPVELDTLRRPGRQRTLAVHAIASTLNRDLYVCRDRARVVAARALDAALDALERQAGG